MLRPPRTPPPRSDPAAARPRPSDPTPPAPERRPSERTILLGIAVLSLIWGSTWLVIRGGLRDLPPLTSAGVRFALAGGIMVLVATRIHRREGGERPPRRLVLVMGGLNFAVSYGVLYEVETVLPSGLVCVLWSVYPLLIAIAGHVHLPGERMAPAQWGGTLLGLVGIVLLFATDLRGLGPEAVPAGLLLMVSPVASVIGNVYVKKHGERVSSALLNRDGMLLGALLLLAAALVLERGAEPRWTPAAVASVAYLSLLGTVTTFGLYFWLLRYAPAYRMAQIAYVTPVVALSLGAGVAGEPVGALTLLGTGLILAGVGLVFRGTR